jgi:hypothetical protein
MTGPENRENFEARFRGEQGRQGDPGPGIPRRVWQAIAGLLAISFILSAAAVLVAGREIAGSQHQWCAVLVTLDNADRRGPPPRTAYGRALAVDFRQLRHSYGCG